MDASAKEHAEWILKEGPGPWVREIGMYRKLGDQRADHKSRDGYVHDQGRHDAQPPLPDEQSGIRRPEEAFQHKESADGKEAPYPQIGKRGLSISEQENRIVLWPAGDRPGMRDEHEQREQEPQGIEVVGVFTLHERCREGSCKDTHGRSD